jgi:hypothetical protein
MNILFLNYLVQSENASLQKRIDAYDEMRYEMQQLVSSNLNGYNDFAFNVIPSIRQNIQNNQNRISALQSELQRISDNIKSRANKEFNSRQTWKWVGVASSAMSMIPSPWTQGASLALNVAANTVGNSKGFNQGQKLFQEGVQLFTSTYSMISSGSGILAQNFGGGQSSILSMIQSKDAGGIWQTASTMYQQNKDLYNNVKGQIDKIGNYYNRLTKGQPGELGQIEGEMLANEPRIGEIKEEMSSIQAEQQQLAQQLQSATEQMLSAKNGFYTSITSVSRLSDAIIDINMAFDHQIVVVSQDMANRVRDRLRKYHYYLAKAYEYRTLKPYTGTLELGNLFDRMQQLISKDTFTLTKSNYDALGSIYTEQVRKIAEDIYTYYNANRPSQTLSSTYRLSKSEVVELNKGKTITLNLVENGLFRPSEEDIRIVSLKVSKVIYTTNKNSNSNFDQVDFKFDYPNFSRIKKNGEVFAFNNYNLSTTNPINWTSRLDVYANTITNSQTSAAGNSLLASLLTGTQGSSNTTNDLLLYSRPAAWADLKVSMDHFTNGNSLVNVDSVFIEVFYDYLPKPLPLVNVEINSNKKWFTPLFNFSNADRYNRMQGAGDVHRSFSKSPGNFISVKAPLVYGRYKFDGWADRNGNDLIITNKDVDTSGGNIIKFTLGTDRSYKAKYKFMGAVMSVPDTVYLGNQSSYSLNIKNSGNGSLNWKIDSLSNWIKYNGSLTGDNDTTIGLTFTSLPSNITTRFGLMDISSTETEKYHHYIYFVQGKNPKDTTGNSSGGNNGGSGTATVNNPDSLKQVYPNPTNKPWINLEFANALVFDANVVILNSNGDLVLTAFLAKGLSKYNLDLTRLANGNYYMKISNNAGLNTVEQIVIRR